MLSRPIRPPSVGRAASSAAQPVRSLSIPPKRPQMSRSSFVPAPKPVPVPTHIERQGAEASRAYQNAYREAFQAAITRGVRLAGHPAAQNKAMALGEMLSAGKSDEEILAALPSAQTDATKRAVQSWRRIAAEQNRCSGFDDPNARRSIGYGWDKIVAQHNATVKSEV